MSEKPLTEAEIAEVERLLSCSYQHPDEWHPYWDDENGEGSVSVDMRDAVGAVSVVVESDRGTEDDIVLIAKLKNMAPRLLATARRAARVEEEREALENERNALRGQRDKAESDATPIRHTLMAQATADDGDYHATLKRIVRERDALRGLLREAQEGWQEFKKLNDAAWQDVECVRDSMSCDEAFMFDDWDNYRCAEIRIDAALKPGAGGGGE